MTYQQFWKRLAERNPSFNYPHRTLKISVSTIERLVCGAFLAGKEKDETSRAFNALEDIFKGIKR